MSVGVQSWFAAVGATPRTASASGNVTATNGLVVVVRFSLAATSITVKLDGVDFTGEMGSNTGITESGGTAVAHCYYFLNIAGGAGSLAVAWSGGGTAKWKAVELPASMMASFIGSNRDSTAANTAFLSKNVASTSRQALIVGLFTSSGIPTYTAGTQPGGGVGYALESGNSISGLEIETQTLTESKLLAADLTASASVTWTAYVAAFAYVAQPVAARTDLFENPVPMTLGPGGFKIGPVTSLWLGTTPPPPTPPPPVGGSRHPLYWIKKEGR